MSTSAIVTMVIGMVTIWGGLAVSITLAIRSHRANTRAGAGPGPRDGEVPPHPDEDRR